jgi:hypothetical protein
VAEVKDSGLYSISADEKADRSKHWTAYNLSSICWQKP